MLINYKFLEEEWYRKLRSAGCGHEDALLLARIKAHLEGDETLGNWIKKEGFDGFCRWIEIHCKDIYFAVKGALQTAWNWLKGLL